MQDDTGERHFLVRIWVEMEILTETPKLLVLEKTDFETEYMFVNMKGYPVDRSHCVESFPKSEN